MIDTNKIIKSKDLTPLRNATQDEIRMSGGIEFIVETLKAGGCSSFQLEKVIIALYKDDTAYQLYLLEILYK